jgi:uncharacterized protein
MSDLEASEQLSQADATSSSGSLSRPWGFWATLGWALLAMIAAGFVEYAFLAAWRAMGPRAITEHNGTFLALRLCISYAAQIAILSWVIQVRDCSVKEYFGLIRPQPWPVVLGAVFAIAFLLISHGVIYALGGVFLLAEHAEIYRSARDVGGLPVLWATYLAAAPAGEEVVYRGFLFRGLSASRLGVTGAIILTSLIWSLIHLPYNWFYQLNIFGLGLLLGWVRWRSGSILPTMLLHAMINFVIVIETMIILGRAP